MATSSAHDWSGARSDVSSRDSQDALSSVTSAIWGACKVLGSLKLTVSLFLFSIIIIYFGTVAQQELNMVEVKQRYFTSWIAQMRLEDGVPRAFVRYEPSGTIPFPGGALIGFLLLVNLVAAKMTRFHIQASGTRLLGGITVFIFGCVLTYFVVASGHSSDGVQGQPPVDYQTLWSGMVSGMAVLWLTAVYKSVTSERKGWKYIWGAVALLFGVLGVTALTGYFQLSVSSLRITWQLVQGTVVGLVLLIGSVLMFGKQGGNLLLHFGVAFLMVGQFAFGDTQLEQRLSLVEGQATNEFVKLEQVELAFIDRSEPDKRHVTAVPEAKLERVAASKETLSDPRLPVDIKVLSFFPNSDIEEVEGDTLATVGSGLKFSAVPRPTTGGVDSEIDLASAYVELFDKQSKESLGVFMVSQLLNDSGFLSLGRRNDLLDTIDVDGKSYEIGLKFARVPKPYWVKVKDVRRITYSGTETPRDFSSYLKLVDSETSEVRDERIWMNNPLRYRGETFYQSDYRVVEGGKEFTSIQVVKNSGWMIPYVACMIVAVGMMYHFGGTLDRFLGRQERQAVAPVAGYEPTAPTKPVNATGGNGSLGWASALVVTGLCMLASVPWTPVMMSLSDEARQEKFNFYGAGGIPTQFGGRVLPLDAYAKQALTAVSNRSSLPLKPKTDKDLPPAPREIVERAGGGRSLSAMQWLFEVASGDETIRDLHMVRIDADEILSLFDLTRRKSKLYSISELVPGFEAFDRELQEAREKDEEERTFRDAKVLELASRLNTFQQLQAAFSEPFLPELPPEFAGMDLTQDQIQRAKFMMLEQQIDNLKSAQLPAIVPPASIDAGASVDFPPWLAYPVAGFENIGRSINGETQLAGVSTFASMVRAYHEKEAEVFNKAVDDHMDAIATASPADYDSSRVSAERWIEAVSPTFVAQLLYGALLVLGLIALLLESNKLRMMVFGGLIGVLVLHTVFILARIYITGRAPVTNLYASAVFIGWATVLAGVILEVVYRRGIGNVVAAGLGISSLMVAWALDTGDTMPVLQAVLDTQFWLSTHVITVTLGYAATFVAGGLGILFLAALLFQSGKIDLRRDIYRMAYSSTCFGILFSFVGTVLGGLWADDSWGRFWGWDPKENGALLIVIWNSLMLHARWDGMVKDRGFAILAIIGNIATAISWFGTNQLGIGLHAYGGNSGAKIWLGIFLLSQILIILAGLVLTAGSPAKRTSE